MACGEIAADRSHHRALPLIRETLQMALQADGERKTPRLHLRGITAEWPRRPISQIRVSGRGDFDIFEDLRGRVALPKARLKSCSGSLHH